jgi:hypothetical protein
MIGGAPRRLVRNPNPGVLQRNAPHAQADFAGSAPLSQSRIKVLSGIIRRKAELGERPAAYRAARCKSVTLGIKRDILAGGQWQDE